MTNEGRDSLIKEIRAEVRIEALEGFVAVLAESVLAGFELFRPGITAEFERALLKSHPVHIPNVDPAMSDLIHAEFEDSVLRLVEMMRRMRESPAAATSSDR